MLFSIFFHKLSLNKGKGDPSAPVAPFPRTLASEKDNSPFNRLKSFYFTSLLIFLTRWQLLRFEEMEFLIYDSLLSAVRGRAINLWLRFSVNLSCLDGRRSCQSEEHWEIDKKNCVCGSFFVVRVALLSWKASVKLQSHPTVVNGFMSRSRRSFELCPFEH